MHGQCCYEGGVKSKACAVQLVVGDNRLAPSFAATRRAGGKPGLGAFLDQVSFELPEGAKDVEDEPAARGWWCR